MNKKQIAALIENMVAKLAENMGLNEVEARTLVGIQIRKLETTILANAGFVAAATPTEPAPAAPASEPVAA